MYHFRADFGSPETIVEHISSILLRKVAYAYRLSRKLLKCSVAVSSWAHAIYDARISDQLRLQGLVLCLKESVHGTNFLGGLASEVC